MAELRTTVETKGVLRTDNGGRVIAWRNDKEPGLVSVAVPGDRAKLTGTEARALARWLVEAAENATPTMRPTTRPHMWPDR